MVKIITVAALGAMVLAGLIGCADPSAWVGTWEGRREIAAPKGADPVIAATLALVRLELKPDGTFELMDGGIAMDGEAGFGRERARLRVLRVLGRPVGRLSEPHPRELLLDRQADGALRLGAAGGFLPEPVLLRRKSQPAP